MIEDASFAEVLELYFFAVNDYDCTKIRETRE
jgi:hypothetical protein